LPASGSHGKGLVVSYLRFTPQEHDAIAHLWRSHDLNTFPHHVLRRLLIEALTDPFPALASRIAQFRNRELRILGDHLRGRRPVHEGHDLNAEELGVVAEAGGPLLCHARFIQPLKRALVRQVHEEHPALAVKLDRLSLRQFEQLCQQVRS
jgi:hypothetical protein